EEDEDRVAALALEPMDRLVEDGNADGRLDRVDDVTGADGDDREPAGVAPRLRQLSWQPGRAEHLNDRHEEGDRQGRGAGGGLHPHSGAEYAGQSAADECGRGLLGIDVDTAQPGVTDDGQGRRIVIVAVARGGDRLGEGGMRTILVLVEGSAQRTR